MFREDYVMRLIKQFAEAIARMLRLRQKGEHQAALSMRKFASMYLRGFAGARRLRERIQTLQSRDDFFSIIDGVFEAGAVPMVDAIGE